MVFQDRKDAGQKLVDLLLQDKVLMNDKDRLIVVSLLRGGVVVGAAIARRLGVENIPLVVTKIPHPYNPELAIGALCQNKVYQNRGEVSPIGKNKKSLNIVRDLARIKNKEYCKKYRISNIKYRILLKNKVVVLVDDGIATGASIIVAVKFIKSCQPKKIILAVPVAPTDFNTSIFSQAFILIQEEYFSAVSQFYREFPQVEEK